MHCENSNNNQIMTSNNSSSELSWLFSNIFEQEGIISTLIWTRGHRFCWRGAIKCNEMNQAHLGQTGPREPRSLGWWDDWDDTVLQTHDSKFDPWRSEAEHATSRSRRLPTILTFTRGWSRNIFLFISNRRDREPNPELWRERQRC